MKTVRLLCLVGLLVMQTTVTYANPVATLNLLKEIEHEANRMDYPEALMDTIVPVIRIRSSHQKCPPEVFCLAEESLHKADPHSFNVTDWKLTELLHNYNTKHSIHCTVENRHSYHLRKMLEELAYCARTRKLVAHKKMRAT